MRKSSTTQFAGTLRSFFSEYLPLTRGLSPETVRSYRDAFILLLRYLAKRHSCPVVDLDFVHLGPADLLAFLDHLEAERGNSISTRNARLAAVHSFSQFAAAHHPEYVETCQQLIAVPIKRAHVPNVEYLESDEIGAMLESVDQKNRLGQRDYALILTLFNTGARVQEALGICPHDLQLDRPWQVLLRGKGRKERICPLWSQTADCLRALLAATSYALDETAPIFRNRLGEPMTRWGVRYILQKYAKRAQTTIPRLLPKRVYPHRFRHSTAVHLLRADVDLVTISQWLGHASVETTNRYAKVNTETKRKALEQVGPIPEITDSALASWKTDASVLEWLESL